MLRRIVDWAIADWALKLTSLVLAFLLWTAVQADTPGEYDVELPVQVQNEDPEWVVADRNPAVVRVVFRGPYRELLRAIGERPSVLVRVQDVTDSTEIFLLRENWVRMPPGTEQTSVLMFDPREVRVTFDRVTTRLIPLAATLTGAPPTGFEVGGPVEIEPNVVRAVGAGRMLARIDSLRLPPIDLRERRDMDTLTLTVDTTGTGVVISPRTVRVVVPVRPILNDTGVLPLTGSTTTGGGGG